MYELAKQALADHASGESPLSDADLLATQNYLSQLLRSIAEDQGFDLSATGISALDAARI